MNFSIRNKLLVASGLATIVALSAAMFGFWLAWQSIRVFQDEVEARKTDERLILATQTEFKKQVQEWKDVLLRGSDPGSLEKYWGNFEKQEHKIQENGDALRKEVEDPKALALIEDFLKAHREMGVAYRKGLQAFKDSGFDSKAGDRAVKGMDRAPTELLTAAAGEVAKISDESAKQAIEKGYKGIITSIVLMLIATAVGGVTFLWLVQRSIISPTHRIVEELDRLATGDFTIPLKPSSGDEIGQVAYSAEKVRLEVGKIVTDIKGAIARLSHASEDLAATTHQTKATTQHQLDETTGIATSIQQVVASVDEVAGKTAAAAQAAESAHSEATNGKEVVKAAVHSIGHLAEEVNQVTDSIRQLGATSQDIGGVVNVIRGIADQTNLLALNAAIEAARAGEQGRGFAVVADEVRNLAQRTQEATRDVQEKIDRLLEGTAEAITVTEEVNSQAGTSSAQAQQAGQALERISAGIATITAMNNQIAEAANRQTASAQAVSQNIGNITEAAHQNSQSFDRTERASQSIAEVASELDGLVRRFRA